MAGQRVWPMRGRGARGWIACAAALAITGAWAPAAEAAEAHVDGSTLVYNASPEEENAVEVTRSEGDFVISDDGADIAPGAQCSQGGNIAMPEPGQVICSGAGVATLRIDVGDRDDSVKVLVSTPAAISGGPGKDELEGGGGADVIDGGSGGDSVRGGQGNDVVDGGPDEDEAIMGEDGNDTVVSQDGTADSGVSCGVGVDSLTADTGDDVSPDCERVTRPCVRPRRGAGVAARRAVRPNRRWLVRLPVQCRAAGCAGRILLRSVGRIGGRHLLVGSTRFTSRRRRSSVALRILSSARATIQRHRGLRVTATLAADPTPCVRARSVVRLLVRPRA